MTQGSNLRLAWRVDEPEEGRGVIVFAEDATVARSMGADRLELDNDDVDEPTRTPQYDAFAPGPVPVSALIDDGWWFECAYCSTWFDGDTEENDDLHPVDPQAGPKPYTAFCCRRCAAGHEAQKRGQVAAMSALLESFSARFPGASVVDAYAGTSGVLETGLARVNFRFPHGTGVCWWYFGESVAHVAQIDSEPFKRWMAGNAPGAMRSWHELAKQGFI